jgi:nitronate monooxygenase
LRNETTAAVKAVEASNPNVTIAELMPLVSGKLARQAYETGDWTHGLLSAGQALAFVDETQPLADIVCGLEREMEQAFNRLDGLRAGWGALAGNA